MFKVGFNTSAGLSVNWRAGDTLVQAKEEQWEQLEASSIRAVSHVCSTLPTEGYPLLSS